MSRTNSTDWTPGNPVTSARLQDFNEDLDNLYSTGSDRLKVYHIAADPAFRVSIGAGTYRVGGTEGQYAGGTVTVSASVTTYIMIDSGGTIQTSTSAWNAQYAKLGVVVSNGSAITSITNWRNDTVGGDFGGNPTGTVLMWVTPTAPSGYLLCDGSAISRTTYSVLFATIAPTKGTFTVTIATPGVVTLTAHGLIAGASFYATTTGALPTGMVANTLYYVSATGLTANTFQFSATRGGASINTTGSQSGVHTLVYCPYGLGNGSTTFNVPTAKGRVAVGFDSSQTEFQELGVSGGSKTHTLITSEIPGHTHDVGIGTSNQNGSPGASGLAAMGGGPTTSASTGGGGAHNNLQPYMTFNFIIKT